MNNPMPIPGEMMPMLSAGLWVVGGGVVLDVVMRGYELLRTVRGEPDKREISLAPQFATRPEVEALGTRLAHVEQAIERIRQEIREDRSALLEAAEQRAAKMHGRINEVLAAVSELQGSLRRSRR